MQHSKLFLITAALLICSNCSIQHPAVENESQSNNESLLRAWNVGVEQHLLANKEIKPLSVDARIPESITWNWGPDTLVIAPFQDDFLVGATGEVRIKDGDYYLTFSVTLHSDYYTLNPPHKARLSVAGLYSGLNAENSLVETEAAKVDRGYRRGWFYRWHSDEVKLEEVAGGLPPLWLRLNATWGEESKSECAHFTLLTWGLCESGAGSTEPWRETMASKGDAWELPSSVEIERDEEYVAPLNMRVVTQPLEIAQVVLNWPSVANGGAGKSEEATSVSATIDARLLRNSLPTLGSLTVRLLQSVLVDVSSVRIGANIECHRSTATRSVMLRPVKFDTKGDTMILQFVWLQSLLGVDSASDCLCDYTLNVVVGDTWQVLSVPAQLLLLGSE